MMSPGNSGPFGHVSVQSPSLAAGAGLEKHLPGVIQAELSLFWVMW